MPLRWRGCWLLAALAGCTSGGDPAPHDAHPPLDATAPTSDSDVPDGRPVDGAPVDADPPDANVRDAAPLDAAPLDAAPFDAAPFDAAPFDAAPFDAAPLDAAALDAAPLDAAPLDATPVDAAPDLPPRPPRAAGPGDLVITELMIDPLAVRDAVGEWIEIANPTADPIEVAGLVLTDGADERAVIEGAGVLRPGGYGVLVRELDPAINGGVEPLGRYVGLLLSNRGDTVLLATAAGDEIDRVVYDGGPDFPNPEGASIQLDADFALAEPNADGARWCASRDPFGAGDRGTPGAPNRQCRGAFSVAELQAFVTTRCPGCHTQGGVLGGLDLDDVSRLTGQPAQAIPALALVEPGDRARSYLYLKLSDAFRAVGGAGTVMPPEGPPLDPVEIERIGRYIDALPR